MQRDNDGLRHEMQQLSLLGDANGVMREKVDEAWQQQQQQMSKMRVERDDALQV